MGDAPIIVDWLGGSVGATTVRADTIVDFAFPTVMMFISDGAPDCSQIRAPSCHRHRTIATGPVGLLGGSRLFGFETTFRQTCSDCQRYRRRAPSDGRRHAVKSSWDRGHPTA
jgi:hypothetical protein